MFEFSGLRQQYDGRTVLDLPSLALDPQGRYALFGENGAGKSTLLNLLSARLLQHLAPDQVGFLPQKPYAFNLKVQHSLELGLPESLQLSKAARTERVERQLDRFGLLDLAGKRADRLSGGESQRLALARLLMVPRRVILLDEPGNHIDRDNLERTISLVQEYIRETHGLLIMATHQVSLVQALTDEVLVLEQGLLKFRGSCQQWQQGQAC